VEFKEIGHEGVDWMWLMTGTSGGLL